MLNRVTSRAIDLIEAAYDLETTDSQWLAKLIDAAAPILDHGLGMFGFNFVRPPPGGGGGDATVSEMYLKSLPADFVQRFELARSAISPEVIEEATLPGYAGAWSALLQSHPGTAELVLQKLGCADLLCILAVDPNGVGVHMSALLPRVTNFASRSQGRLQMLGAHITAGYRLRRVLTEKNGSSLVSPAGLPRDAEAVFDAESFRFVDAVGRAAEPSAAEILREAARRVDLARGALRREDPQRALETWSALVDGRWSLVDWFDTDGRRFILAMPNPPEIRDPRGLTEQERQVVMYAILGESGKLIGYRLGLSKSRVSGLLRSAMRKLGVSSRAALIQKLLPLGTLVPAADVEPER